MIDLAMFMIGFTVTVGLTGWFFSLLRYIIRG